jgi:membrane-associated phospholipid phosphatase
MKRTALALSIAMTTFARVASAQTSAAEAPVAATQSSAVVSPTQVPAPPPTSLVPSRAQTPPLPDGKNRFTADPVGDGAILGIALGFGALSEAILGTGEIRPQQVLTTYDTNRLFFIDRGALTQTIDTNASLYSTVGLVAVVSFAVIDPVLTGFREQSRRAALVDAVIYAETLSIAWGITNLAKVTVRRPRPSAYITAAAHKGDPTFNNTDTDSALSFFSGHAAICASVSATATYLAFSRSGPSSARPWITLIAGTLLTGFVAVERVRSGAHFPTDVIAGSLAGAGVGILVPHLHREDTVTQRPIWVGFAPIGGGNGEGGTATLSGIF